MHSQLISGTGGSDGLRDVGLLESAINSPFQQFGNEDLYPTIQQKASRLCFGLVNNHPFIDGNKRTAVIFSNHYLISKGKGIIAIPAELAEEFKNLLIPYYEGKDEKKIKKFIESWL